MDTNDYQDILSTEDCVISALEKEFKDDILRRYGPWYYMSDEERWEHLRISNMAYYVH